MRSVAAPEHANGACDGTEVRDTRIQHRHRYGMCRDQEMFNTFVLSGLFRSTPRPMCEALSLQMRTDHRIVLTHCDLTPRNILIRDCQIAGLIDWEHGGWYPEYWEYVKFSSAQVRVIGKTIRMIFSLSPTTRNRFAMLRYPSGRSPDDCT
jgi:hypothetical protein